MSNIETHVGKIKELTPPDHIDNFISELSLTSDEVVNTKNYTIYINDDNSGYIYTKTGKLFIIEDEEGDSESINFICRSDGNEYNFVFQFYNGGTHFLEELRDGLDKIFKQS